MSGFIKFAIWKHHAEGKKKDGFEVWKEEMIVKRKNQSDQGFKKQMEKLSKRTGSKGILKKDITLSKGLLKKDEVSYFDGCEVDVTTKVRTIYV